MFYEAKWEIFILFHESARQNNNKKILSPKMYIQQGNFFLSYDVKWIQQMKESNQAMGDLNSRFSCSVYYYYYFIEFCCDRRYGAVCKMNEWISFTYKCLIISVINEVLNRARERYYRELKIHTFFKRHLWKVFQSILIFKLITWRQFGYISSKTKKLKICS